MKTIQTRGALAALAVMLMIAALPVYADSRSDVVALFQLTNTAAVNNDLTFGERTSLVTKLIGAIASIDKGHENTAANQLDAFQHEVDAMQRSGRLPAADAQVLSDAADAIIAQL